MAPTVREMAPEYCALGPPDSIRAVFDELPELMCETLTFAAEQHPDEWISYERADKAVGNPPGTFKSSFGGYHSHDAERPRPFHLGQSVKNGRFFLRVDPSQTEAILGS